MKKKKNHKNLFNLKLTMLFLVFFFILVVIKLSYVALSDEVDGTNLTEFVANRNTTTEILYATRGSIYDINGEEYAKNSNSYTVIAYLSESRTTDEDNPQHVVDKEATAAALAPLINMTEETILELLNRSVYQVELGPGGRDIGEDVKKKIEALDLPGITFTVSQKRTYKNKNYASYILGYARQEDEDDEITGKMGIEAYFDEYLKGKNGYRIYQSDAYGYQIPNTEERGEEAVSGSDVYLSIDNSIQLILENTLAYLQENNELDWATFTVMNAKTGAIVGSASIPNFNPNTLEDITSYLNPLTSYQYEPGSTMKIFSYLAAIENGIYDGSKTFTSGSITLSDGTIISDFNKTGWGTITFDVGFAYSSNVGATYLGLELGAQKLQAFYELCGFGSKTGITLPGESSGTLNITYESEVASASFGQGITITPVQMLQALSALVNDGTMVKPYIVDRIISSSGETEYSANTEYVGTIASSESIDTIKSLMYDVVYNGFSYNAAYAPENVTIAGKTGTAQIASSSGGYETGEYDYIKSFAGIFPYEDPEYVFYFVVKKLVGTTSDMTNTVSTAIGEIAKELNVTTTSSDVDYTKIVTIDNYISSKTDTTVSKLENLGLDVVVLGTGDYIIDQYPKVSSVVVDQTKIFLVTNSSDYTMPDVSGWSSSDIIKFCEIAGIEYTVTDYGTVASTNYETGEALDYDKPVEIVLTH